MDLYKQFPSGNISMTSAALFSIYALVEYIIFLNSLFIFDVIFSYFAVFLSLNVGEIILLIFFYVYL